MGVSGLLTWMTKRSYIPGRLKTEVTDKRNILLVDGLALLRRIVRDSEVTTDFRESADVYSLIRATARAWTEQIRESKLYPVVVVDSNTATRSRRRADEGFVGGPLALTAFVAGCAEGGAHEIWYAKMGDGDADASMLAYWARNKDRVAAVLTNDSDFLAHGVSRVALLETLLFSDGGADCELWDGLSCRGKLGVKNAAEMYRAAALFGTDEGVATRGAVERAWRRKGGLPAAVAALLEHLHAGGEANVGFLTSTIGLTRAASEEFMRVIRKREETDAAVAEVADAALPDAQAYKTMFHAGKPFRDPYAPAYVVQMWHGGASDCQGEYCDKWSDPRNVARRRAALDAIFQRSPFTKLEELDTAGKVLEVHRASDEAERGVSGPPLPRGKVPFEAEVCEVFHLLLEAWAAGESAEDKAAALDMVAAPPKKGGPDLLRRMRRRAGEVAQHPIAAAGRVTKDEWDEVDGRGGGQAARLAATAIKGRMITGRKLLDGSLKPNPTQMVMLRHALTVVQEFGEDDPDEGEEAADVLALATPPGTGKTTGALLLSMALNKMGYVLVYSVPTKQVLIRVAQECEVARVVYWVVSKSALGQYEVRRPYSVRTMKTRAGMGGTSSAMIRQLEIAGQQAKECSDRTAKGVPVGSPGMLLCDIDSVAELMSIRRSVNGGKLALFVDEPNFGFGWPEMQERMRALLTTTPPLTILASATLTASEAEYMLPERHAVFETGTKAGRPAVRVEANGEWVATVAGGKVDKKAEVREHTGVEMVLCANPAARAMAFGTDKAKHEVQRAHAEVEKALQRHAKKAAKQRVVNIGPDDDAPTNRFKCGRADLDTRTVEELGLDTCGMLYAGVAYIDSRETGEHARALRAHLAPMLLREPPKVAGAGGLIRQLYVDYSCVYGLDALAITKVTSLADAEGVLNDGDLVQLAGRLRGGGTVNMASKAKADKMVFMLSE